jgi:hypothetical protein
MTLRTFVDKNSNTWEWNETPEVIAAIKNLTKFVGNYKGPLYALHPDLKNENTTES